jgi:iron-sulfur cluster assembly protein
MTQAISEKRGIQMTDSAVRQVLALREKQGKDLCLRVGVRQGGCSGMSYVMDFADPSTVRPDDEVFDYEGFQEFAIARAFFTFTVWYSISAMP